MSKTLKEKAIKGMFWTTIERFGSSLLLFVSNIILARLLLPSDFGCIGMLLVFVSLSDAIVDGGFGSALIQKKKPTQRDYSTIFFWNIFLSIILYVVLCCSAPFIAGFYKIDAIADILKVQGLVLILNALFLVQKNILIKQISFKRVAKINLLGIVIGSAIGVACAYLGLGIWSLVVKSLSTALIQCATYWVVNKWRPCWLFSWQSFVDLFKFGSFMFLTVVFNTLYHNILSLIIGKNFSPSVLGYFTQAKKLEDLPRSSISSVATSVLFPVFSEIQDDKERLRNTVHKCLQSLMFINVPVMLLLIVIAKPLILMLFTEKWEQSIPYFQALCVYGIFVTPNELNRSISKAIGKSKITLFVLIIQRSLGILLIFCGLYWGVNGLLMGYVLSEILSYCIYGIVVGKLIQYGLYKQLKCFLPILCVSIVAMILSYMLSNLMSHLDNIMLMCLQFVVFILVYISLSLIFRIQGVERYVDFIKINFK